MLHIWAGSIFKLTQGTLNYKNVTSNSLVMGNDISIFFVQQNTKLNLYQSMSYTQGIVRFGDNTTLARVVGKKIFGSIDAAGVLTFKNLQV